MNILITNDDGVCAPALPHLIRWARQFVDVTAIAPKLEQSGKSHAIDFMKEIEIKQVELAPDVTAYSVDSTPADCVRYGVTSLGKKFDLVISGINRGYNLGADIVYSGTIGAVFEACRLGIPGIALSANPGDESDAVKHLDAVAAFIREHKLLEQHKIPYTPHFYGETGAVGGAEVAQALGEPMEQVFKTLVTVGKSGQHYVFVIPVAQELDLRKAAASVGEKNIEMIKSKELLPLTGYIHGGCSPIGMKKLLNW